MRTNRPITARPPLRDRISFRLGMHFLVTFLGTLLVLGILGLINAYSERGQAAEEINVKAPAIVIDPKLQADLAKAMAFDAIPAEAQVQNPFLDRAGLSGIVTKQGTTVSNVGSTQSSAASSRNTELGGTLVSGLGGSGGRRFSSGSEISQPVYDMKSRFDDWIERQRRGQAVEPESQILAIEDLVPVGYASGGDRGAEVFLFSSALCRTFSFPAGTRFYNGYLSGFDQNEVVFTLQSGLTRKSYSNSETCRPTADARAAATSN